MFLTEIRRAGLDATPGLQGGSNCLELAGCACLPPSGNIYRSKQLSTVRV